MGAQVVGDATVEGSGCILAAHAVDDAREGSVQTRCRVLARGGQSEEEDVVCSYALLEFREERCDTRSSGNENASSAGSVVGVGVAGCRVVEEVSVGEFEGDLVPGCGVGGPRRAVSARCLLYTSPSPRD